MKYGWIYLIHITNRIMETMLIELTIQKADKLLHELEELHIIKVLNKNVSTGIERSENMQSNSI